MRARARVRAKARARGRARARARARAGARARARARARVPRLRHVVLPLELRVNGGIIGDRVLGGMHGGQQLLYLNEAACAGLGLGSGPARG